ncbi:MAG: DNA repair protein RadA [Deltaproteobacteria bacterium]|nr:DNA repair protein RadA [Candidatus Anaeroferrophillus wilburensis]MBN2889945.1 DNA repair protein RadA [Deltaproteobacteria bacterium]
MRKKQKTFFACSACGHQSPKWLGKCPACESWNTFEEERLPTNDPAILPELASIQTVARPMPLNKIRELSPMQGQTRIAEFDRVLGGGIVPGSVTLVGGDPGIGKSTLLLQVLGNLSTAGQLTLYVTGEESPGQVKLRSQRMDIAAPSLYLLATTDISNIIAHCNELQPQALVIDSIQTVTTPEHNSPPGSVTQIRQATAHLISLAKATNIPLFLIGHVTKEGAIAGPRVLEHMVDTVLYFESGTQHPYRILRAVKNRFGSTNEIGVFEMTGRGLQGVDSPSHIFLAERPANLAGSLVTATMEGSRPILTEIQALVSTSVATGIPRRTMLGIDKGRASLMIAVMEKRLNMLLGDKDIFLNVIGGLKIIEPAIDLGLVAVMLSSYLDKPIAPTTMVLGEVGLTGEIRRANLLEQRLLEAEKFGFQKVIIPKNNLKRTDKHNVALEEISSIRELPAVLFP